MYITYVLCSQAIHEARQAEEKLAIVEEKFKVLISSISIT